MTNEPDDAGPALLDPRAQCAAIERAFLELPIAPPAAGREGLSSWSSLIPRIAAQILGMHRPPRPKLPDKEALGAVVRSADWMLEAVENCSARAIDAIKVNLPDPALNSLSLLLHRLRAAAQYAEVYNNIGRPKTTTAKSIAEFCALHYYYLTGKKPTHTNQFGKLLKEIFGILGMDKSEASARSRAKAVARDWQSILKKGF